MQEAIRLDRKPLYYSYKTTLHLIDRLQSFENRTYCKKMKSLLFQEYKILAYLEKYLSARKNRKTSIQLI